MTEGDRLSKREDIEKRTEELLKDVADKNSVKIYDVEYAKEGSDFFLRCYIDKEGGVTIDDCENVSRAMSDLLDKNDYIDDAYILEVSSPGLGRSLKKDRHLEYSIGEEVEVKLFKPPEGSKQKEFTGILKSFDESTITVTIDNDTVFERKNIANIRLTLDF